MRSLTVLFLTVNVISSLYGAQGAPTAQEVVASATHVVNQVATGATKVVHYTAWTAAQLRRLLETPAQKPETLGPFETISQKEAAEALAAYAEHSRRQEEAIRNLAQQFQNDFAEKLTVFHAAAKEKLTQHTVRIERVTDVLSRLNDVISCPDDDENRPEEITQGDDS